MKLYDHLTKIIKTIGNDNSDNSDNSDNNSTNYINIYVCGSTVHAISHIGHARTYATFDSMRKYLISKGKVVNYGMNITDIDDKINTKVRALHYFNTINNLNKLDEILEINLEIQEYFKSNRLDKISPNILNCVLQKLEETTEKYVTNGTLPESVLTPSFTLYKQFIDEKTNLFWKEMEQINVSKPTTIIRVSDVIPQIENMIDTLIQKEFAYESNGSVYFDTANYYKHFENCNLSNATEDDKSIKQNYESDKKNSQDFALWKAGKPRSINFNSKWGLGTVGWHIECSLMSSMMFGNNIHLHGGGIDLKYPHHHNEVLQSNSYFNISNVFKHFTYAGHVCKNGEKMAQSVGNYSRLEDYLHQNSANSIRLLFWLVPWYNPMELTDDLIKQANILESRIDEFLSTINFYLSLDKNYPNLNHKSTIVDIINNFTEIDLLLENNFKTTEALLLFGQIMTTTNTALKNDLIDKVTLKNILRLTNNFLEIIGFVVKSDNISNNISNSDSNDEILIKKLFELRELLRKNKQYQISDYVRDDLFPSIGYEVQDMKDGPKIKKIVKIEKTIKSNNSNNK